MTKLVKGTDFGNTTLDTFGKFAAKNLPVLYVPNPPRRSRFPSS